MSSRRSAATFFLPRIHIINAGWAFATAFRLDGLAWGVILALVLRNQTWWLWITSHSRLLSGACGFLFLIVAVDSYFPAVLDNRALDRFTVLAAFFALLVLLSVSCPPRHLGLALALSPLQYLGKVSYGAYIFHQGVHGLVAALLPSFGRRLNPLWVASSVLLSAGITLLLAQLSWRFMENRLIRRAHASHTY